MRLKKSKKIQEAAAAALVSKGQSVVDYAYQFLGNPYVREVQVLRMGRTVPGLSSQFTHILESASQGHPMNREQRG